MKIDAFGTLKKYYLFFLVYSCNFVFYKKKEGGACIAFTNRVILIGTFNEKAKDVNGKN